MTSSIKIPKPWRGDRVLSRVEAQARNSAAPPGLRLFLLFLVPTARAVGYILPPLTRLISAPFDFSSLTLSREIRDEGEDLS
jgi:hypothetical protein